MISRSFDIRNQGLSKTSSLTVPTDIEEFDASHNKFSIFDFDFFFNKSRVWSIDVSHNQLTSLSFLRCIKSIGFLDISNNFLDLEELFNLRDKVIVRISLDNNNFDEVMQKNPLLIPTILSKAWIINGVFITDEQRSIQSSYVTSLEFGDAIIGCCGGHFKNKRPLHISAAKAGKDFIFEHDFIVDDGVTFVPPLGVTPLKIDEFSQSERIRYLATTYFNCFKKSFLLPNGEFSDYFGLTLGILSYLWIGQSIDLIPRLLCRIYWFNISEEIQKMENWELTVVLLQILDRVTEFDRQIECDIWKAVNLEKYIKYGAKPVLGTTPRLIISAFSSRAIALSENPSETTTSDLFADDLRTYFKYRRTCGFTQFQDSNDLTSTTSSISNLINNVFMETAAPFYQPSGLRPEKNDRIEFIHPLTDEWLTSSIKSVRNGRIFIVMSDIVVQIPTMSVFWDGRGIWREASKKDISSTSSFLNGKQNANLSTRGIRQNNTFITDSQQQIQQKLNLFEEDFPIFQQSESANTSHNFSTMGWQPKSARRSKPSQKQNADDEINRNGRRGTLLNMEMMRSTIVFAQKNRDIDDLENSNKLMPGWREFRGIVDLPLPKSQRTNRVHPNGNIGISFGNKIKDVVNIVQSQEYIDGKPIKRFNVKLFNEITKKMKFIWITEDEISKEEAGRLNEMYKLHVAEKVKTTTNNFK